MVKYTGWSKLYIFQQKKVTNLVINQHCLHFKCMKVNILSKCITRIPNLQQIIVLYRVCTTYIIRKSKIPIFFIFWYTLYILNSILIKTDVNLPNKTVFSNDNWNQSLNVHLVEYKGWSNLCVNIILATLYITLCDHPICIFINKYLYISFITMCVKYDGRT